MLKKTIPHHNLNFPSSKSSYHHPTFQTKWDTGFNQGKKTQIRVHGCSWNEQYYCLSLTCLLTQQDVTPPPPPNQQEEDTSGQEMDVFRAAAFYGNTTSKSISIWTDWPELKVNIISKNTLARRANKERGRRSRKRQQSEGLVGGGSCSCLSRLRCLSPHQGSFLSSSLCCLVYHYSLGVYLQPKGQWSLPGTAVIAHANIAKENRK